MLLSKILIINLKKNNPPKILLEKRVLFKEEWKKTLNSQSRMSQVSLFTNFLNDISNFAFSICYFSNPVVQLYINIGIDCLSIVYNIVFKDYGIYCKSNLN